VLPPDHSGSTKAGKALIDTLIKNHGLIAVPGQGISFKGEQQKGKKPVDLLRHDDFETMLAVQDAIENSQDPGAYALRHILKEGVSEQSLFWIDEETGLLCKCRPDHYNSTAGGVCLDLKFVKKGGAEIEQFKKDIVNYRYHVQAPWYRMGFMALGLPCERFVFGVVEKEPPYLIQCYNATPAMLEQGKMEAEQNLAQFAHCVKTDKWPGLDYGEPVVDIDLPGWYK
jgi:exodeoxyribonuclease VIII